MVYVNPNKLNIFTELQHNYGNSVLRYQAMSNAGTIIDRNIPLHFDLCQTAT